MTAEIEAFATAPVFEATASPYLIVDPNFRIRAVNEAYESATAHPRSVLLGQQLFEAFPDNPALPAADGVANLSASLETVLRTGRRHRMPVQRYDVPDLSNPDGFLYKVWAPVNSPIRDDRGRTVAVLHHVEDVTELFPPVDATAGRKAADVDGAPSLSVGRRDWTALLEGARHQCQVSRELSRQVETLREAVDTNRQIGVAIGLLMAATGGSRDAAFALLRQQSQSSNRKLRDVAADLVALHERRAPQTPELRPPVG